jgi:hypothetical protein
MIVKIKTLVLSFLLFTLMFQAVSAESTTAAFSIPSNGAYIWWNYVDAPSALVQFTVNWTPARKGLYEFVAYRSENYQGGTPDMSYYCINGGKHDKPGKWVCTFRNAPAGYYLAMFRSIATPASGTVTMQVDP